MKFVSLSCSNYVNFRTLVKKKRFKGWSITSTGLGSTRHEYKTMTGYVTGKLYKFLKQLMSKSTSWCSNSSQSVSCTSPSFPQWFDSKAHHWVLQWYNVTEGAGLVTLPMVTQYPAQQQESPGMQDLRLDPTVLPIQLAWSWAISGGWGGGLTPHLDSSVHNPLSWSPSSSLPTLHDQQLVSEGLHHAHISSNSSHSLTKHREEMVGYHTLLLVSLAFHSHTLNLHSVPSAGICLHSVGHPAHA